MPTPVWNDLQSLANYLEYIVRLVSEYDDLEDGTKRYRYRNVWNHEALQEVCADLKSEFSEVGYAAEEQEFIATFGYERPSETEPGIISKPVKNLIAEKRGDESPEEIIILGAHYDSRAMMKGERGIDMQRGRIPLPENHPHYNSKWKTPGANDNGSGVAALLALADAFKDSHFKRTLRFVAWVNEEPPFYANTYKNGKKNYRAEGMGSFMHAERCAGQGIDGSGVRENIVGVISLETMGWYPGDEYKYPGRNVWELAAKDIMNFPPRGDYVAFLSNANTRGLVRDFERHYKNGQPGVRAISRYIPWIFDGILRRTGSWSDDWSYWYFGYPAFTVTDLAYLRSPRYHRDDDTAEHMNFPEFAQVVWQLRSTIGAFANQEF